jgi:alginate O-acetyltransferase complex protein AlgI
MIFSSPVFIFIFLPIVLGIYFLLDKKFRNLFILISSLFFYAWGEYVFVILLMYSICVNYIAGILISRSLEKQKTSTAKVILSMGIILNLTVLLFYKYIHFLVASISHLGININYDFSGIALPLGISFFTFKSISYLIDVFRKTVKSEQNLINLGMYISLFPQLIAGPIGRYVDISKEIEERVVTLEIFETGITRFITGLAKKVIIANNIGFIVDKVFAIPAIELSSALSWIGIVCYTLQIYYDFSGYSDMAIGLGKMFGFNFKENFDHPYISTSVQEFWKRWHISLATWFRDYLFFPLAVSISWKISSKRILFLKKDHFIFISASIVTWFLTGLWHGASWNFVVWGLFHGTFLVIEKVNKFKLNSKLNILRRFYLLIIVMVGWVIFRAESLEYSMIYIKRLFILSSGTNNYPYLYFNNYIIIIICIAIIFTTPVIQFLNKKAQIIGLKNSWVTILSRSFYIIIFITSLMEMAQATYNPFIYFKF